MNLVMVGCLKTLSKANYQDDISQKKDHLKHACFQDAKTKQTIGAAIVVRLIAACIRKE